MTSRIDVLDFGSVELIEAWGSDERIVETARVSTQKGFLGWGPTCGDCGAAKGATGGLCENGCGRIEKSGDEKLLAFLHHNKHSTPFEFAGMTIEVQAPIFVFREWHRHRTQSYSEASARYMPLPDVHYVPTVERCMQSGGANKQAGAVKGADELTKGMAEAWLAGLENLYAQVDAHYQAGLRSGIPKEIARVGMPVGRYSRMRATANLRNWLAFITLRSAPNAQWEIQQYSNVVGRMVAERFPRTWALFAEGRP